MLRLYSQPYWYCLPVSAARKNTTSQKVRPSTKLPLSKNETDYCYRYFLPFTFRPIISQDHARLYKTADIVRYALGRAMFLSQLRISRPLPLCIQNMSAQICTQAARKATPSPCKYQADQEPEISSILVSCHREHRGYRLPPTKGFARLVCHAVLAIPALKDHLD